MPSVADVFLFLEAEMGRSLQVSESSAGRLKRESAGLDLRERNRLVLVEDVDRLLHLPSPRDLLNWRNLKFCKC